MEKYHYDSRGRYIGKTSDQPPGGGCFSSLIGIVIVIGALVMLVVGLYLLPSALLIALFSSRTIEKSFDFAYSNTWAWIGSSIFWGIVALLVYHAKKSKSI